jgi:hypothetical protein
LYYLSIKTNNFGNIVQRSRRSERAAGEYGVQSER